MRPTDERGRPIGASPGGLPAAGGLRGGRAAAASAAAGFDIGLHRAPDRCTNCHFVLSVVEKPSSKVSLVYCGLFETEIVLHWFLPWKIARKKVDSIGLRSAYFPMSCVAF